MPTSSQFAFFFYFLFISLSFADGTQLIIVNNCKESIWPGLLATAGHPTPYGGGFHLHSGEEQVLQLPTNWSGRIWPRQGCCFDPKTDKGACQTGDCAGLLRCAGSGGKPPATVVEMTLGTPNSALHYYDVSLVDGFNMPVSMRPIGGGGGRGCGVAACEADLNACCPAALAVVRGGKVVACKSACLAASWSDRYCCRGEFASPQRCKPTVFNRLFKVVCPRAYSYAFDESTGLHSCMAPRYVITFCPPILSSN
ncbi:Thaumatin [Parasponia andersonii]|uniref:Thaumatin n=1 Tax=Parasponia andersonii TaxID=3476 RepID=A0A2P5BAL6_PARAD|nr:Thaumatin [Parasponia andersonii]